VFVVPQGELQLVDGLVDSFDGRHAMASKIMGPMFQVLAGFAEIGHGGANFGMGFAVAVLSRGSGFRLRRARRRRHGYWKAERENEYEQSQRTGKWMFHVSLLNLSQSISVSEHVREIHFIYRELSGARSSWNSAGMGKS
jgi:hypothetical protein